MLSLSSLQTIAMAPRKVLTDWTWVAAVDGRDEISKEHVVRAAGLHHQCLCRRKCPSPYCVNFKHKQVRIERENDPVGNARSDVRPVGLTNLGATCYANAFIQVWFQDRILRAGVYSCVPSTPPAPIHHLATTFAALEHSAQNVYNPASLVESLRLEKGSQQDASEFSKLFMSLIASELETQSQPKLRTLIKDRFEGSLAYSTLCSSCRVESQKETPFTELELSLKNDESLAQRLDALLAPEGLNGDNKYRCSNCDELRDATRRIKLNRLPPVLHISLLRFVFDPLTMARKKTKENITFPGRINMAKYTAQASTDDWYELRAIVTHRGPSAQRGHFVCEVYDTERDKWFLCNDQDVEEITTPGNLQNKPVLKLVDGKLNANKKRVADSGTDVERLAKQQKTLDDSPSTKPRAVKLGPENHHSSKEAYLLLYARENVSTTSDVSTQPSAEVMSVIADLNDKFKSQVDEYQTRSKAFEEAVVAVDKARERVLELMSSITEPRIHAFNTEDLQAWLDRPVAFPTVEEGTGLSTACGSPLDHKENIAPSRLPGVALRALSFDADNSMLSCVHGNLSPWATNLYKLLSESARKELDRLGYKPTPALTVNDICRQCVVDEFEARKAKADRTSELDMFARLSKDDSGNQYYVSKMWLAAWRKGLLPIDKSTGRRTLQNVHPYSDEVSCPHGGLTETMNATSVSSAAYEYLQTLLPGFEGPLVNASPCLTCADSASSDAGDVQESVIQAKTEKARLSFLTKSKLHTKTTYPFDEPLYLVPCDFIDQWRAWQQAPQRRRRPVLDTSSLFCEHAMLRFDPQFTILQPPVCWQIPQPIWETLTEIYGSVQEVFVRNGANPQPGRTTSVESCSVKTCEPCRRRDALDFSTTTITVYPHRSDTPIEQMTAEATCPADGDETKPITYGRSTVRRSNRLRPFEIIVSKGDTVLDLKQQISKQIRVKPWFQRIFLCGVELSENDKSVTAIGLLATDQLHMLEVEQADETDFDMLDHDPSPNDRIELDGGFGGTALVGGALPSTSPAATEPSDKPCPACTFVNVASRTVCEICESNL